MPRDTEHPGDLILVISHFDAAGSPAPFWEEDCPNLAAAHQTFTRIAADPPANLIALEIQVRKFGTGTRQTIRKEDISHR